jgi:hypothetical protein
MQHRPTYKEKEMEENDFWLRIWGMGTLIIVCLIASCTAGSFDRRAKWEKAVAGGADPMAVSCALYEQNSAENIICASLAQNKK